MDWRTPIILRTNDIVRDKFYIISRSWFTDDYYETYCNEGHDTLDDAVKEKKEMLKQGSQIIEIIRGSDFSIRYRIKRD